MGKQMLIDASHTEETRVVILNQDTLEGFDFETSTKQQYKENVYLARVVRVEPSLQAAFVEFGGNRHGFLAFNEIHPDYYRVPVADREAFLKAERDEKELDEDEAQARENLEENADELEVPKDSEEATEGEAEPEEEVSEKEDADLEERASPLSKASLRPYKIQEVIKRRQVMLVQVIKDERGGKGAALTTFISLAGRYCVLMANSPRGGGISRKIATVKDRKRLRDMIDQFEIPEGMGLIVRTAGLGRTKTEIKRDFDYLLRLWNEIRDQTLSSTAPALIYAESDLITRSIRDLYHKDITDVLVEGEQGYKKAKNLMRMLMPSHAKRVQLYKDPSVPLFQKYAIEDKLDDIHSPVVQLPSGGYLVINPTEALVSIDINSGKSTRERHIEETALKTNLEAADAIARQLRLRDLAGLVVIDFIDMELAKNNHAVERRFREALKEDRARIRVGSISIFGLLEMSRERLRPSLIEASSTPCVSCSGTGLVRSVESSTLRVLRALEKECVENTRPKLRAFVSMDVAFYLLNNKRESLAKLEERYKVQIQILQDNALIRPDFRLESVGEDPSDVTTLVVSSGSPEPASKRKPNPRTKSVANTEDADTSKEPEKKKRRRNRGRNRRNREEKEATASPDVAAVDPSSASQPDAASEKTKDLSPQTEGYVEPEAEAAPKSPKRRRSRGRYGRSNRGEGVKEAVKELKEGLEKKEQPQSAGASIKNLKDHKKIETKKNSSGVSTSVEPLKKSPSQAKNPKKGWWQRLLDN